MEALSQNQINNAKPILFNAEMVKAILDGRKTQTRRVIKNEMLLDHGYIAYLTFDGDISISEFDGCDREVKKAPYKVGDILWVREPAKVVEFQDDGNYGGSWIEARAIVKYLADDTETSWDEFPENPKSWLWECKGIPNGCCKSLARIFLRVKNIRAERLQDISDDDILSEGIENKSNYHAAFIEEDNRNDWIKLWNSTAPKGYKWEDNPWNLVYEFEVIETK